MTTVGGGAEAVAGGVEISDDDAAEGLGIFEVAGGNAAEDAAKGAVACAGGDAGSLEVSEGAEAGAGDLEISERARGDE